MFQLNTFRIDIKKGKSEYFAVVFLYLNRVGNVETLLQARDVELDHPQVFAFDYDGSQRPYKSNREVGRFD